MVVGVVTVIDASDEDDAGAACGFGGEILVVVTSDDPYGTCDCGYQNGSVGSSGRGANGDGRGTVCDSGDDNVCGDGGVSGGETTSNSGDRGNTSVSDGGSSDGSGRAEAVVVMSLKFKCLDRAGR